MRIALAGNPNSGKTTLFNHLTGSRQYVGNRPGVTVEKKQGKIGKTGAVLEDLPGVYSLSPYTAEEIITRDCLLAQPPDAIINILDGSNLERNLYLTTQILELGIPVVLAVNMMDIVRRRGDAIDMSGLSLALGCPVIETCAATGEGAQETARAAIRAAQIKTRPPLRPLPCAALERALGQIAEIISPFVPSRALRFYSVKLFERDARVQAGFPPEIARRAEKIIRACERELDSDSESIVIDTRYNYIEGLTRKYLVRSGGGASKNIDKIVTHRLLALPIFAAVIFLVYYIAINAVGGAAARFMSELFIGTWVRGGAQIILQWLGTAPMLEQLVLRGIIGGVGAVLGYFPQIFTLFLLLAVLEECGYMPRVAFILDRPLRRFGLSGKSFIPMLIGTGCSVPGILASRTIESDRDRRMTIITTSFMPCGAKMPVIALISSAALGSPWWSAAGAYFIGIFAVILSGLILKKTRSFSGKPSPFVLELPDYHVPSVVSVLQTAWSRGWSFIKKAGAVILPASVLVWFLSSFGTDFSPAADMSQSILARAGGAVDIVFVPLGFGHWQAVAATLMGLAAKEEIVGVFGVLYGPQGIGGDFTAIGAVSFLLFNLLCMPCAAAVSAIWREMGSARQTAFAVCYQTGFAYAVSLIVYQFGLYFSGGGISIFTFAAIFTLTAIVYMVLRPESKAPAHSAKH